MTSDLHKAIRNRLQTSAHAVKTVSSHATLIGAGREAAIKELVQPFLPKHYEMLTGSLVFPKKSIFHRFFDLEQFGDIDTDLSLPKVNRQTDFLIVDTFNYPPILRLGDIAFVAAGTESIRIEVKSGQKMTEGLQQIASLSMRISREYRGEVSDSKNFLVVFKDFEGTESLCTEIADYINESINQTQKGPTEKDIAVASWYSNIFESAYQKDYTNTTISDITQQDVKEWFERPAAADVSDVTVQSTNFRKIDEENASRWLHKQIWLLLRDTFDDIPPKSESLDLGSDKKAEESALSMFEMLQLDESTKDWADPDLSRVSDVSDLSDILLTPKECADIENCFSKERFLKALKKYLKGKGKEESKDEDKNKLKYWFAQRLSNTKKREEALKNMLEKCDVVLRNADFSRKKSPAAKPDANPRPHHICQYLPEYIFIFGQPNDWALKLKTPTETEPDYGYEIHHVKDHTKDGAVVAAFLAVLMGALPTQHPTREPTQTSELVPPNPTAPYVMAKKSEYHRTTFRAYYRDVEYNQGYHAFAYPSSEDSSRVYLRKRGK